MAVNLVSASFFRVVGVNPVIGRAFGPADDDRAGGNPVIVLSDKGWERHFKRAPDVLGRNVLVYGAPFEIIGVMPEGFRGLEVSAPDLWAPLARLAQFIPSHRRGEDTPGIEIIRLTDVKESGVFLPTSLEVPKTSVVARIQGDADLARQTLLEHLTRVDPNMGMIVTMRTVARLEQFFLQIAFWVSLILGGLALLTVSGLFSVLSYLVEQRTKEIGLRMALGATSQKVTQMMLAQTTRPVLYGLLAGAGLAAVLATVVLATPAGALIGEIVRVTDPVAYAASLIVIVAACLLAAWIPASRASRVDPMKALRQE
jgi:ABC-type antimicrobial peptide transport system permease subunit